MANSNYTDEQIDDYIMGLLDENQKSLFEKELKTDAALSLYLKERKELILGIEEYHAQKFKDKLKVIHSKNFETPPTQIAKKRNLRSWLAIAATVAFLIVAMMWMNNSSYSSSKLYAANFQPYEMSFSQRGNEDEKLLRLEDLYKTGKYEDALPLFEELNKQSSSSKMLLGAGISKLALNQAEKALVDFKLILDNGDLLFKDHARWYTALAYLQLDNQSQAKLFLELLAKDKGADHYMEAVDLLKKMD